MLFSPHIVRMKRSVFLIVALCCFAGFAALVKAQAPRQMTTVERRIDTMNRQGKEYDWEDMSRVKRKEAARSVENAKRSKQIRTEIEKDLKAIQAAYNDILTVLHAKTELDDQYAFRSASEVKKHAARLKINLSLPEPDGAEKPPAASVSVETRKSLTELCRRIRDPNRS